MYSSMLRWLCLLLISVISSSYCIAQTLKPVILPPTNDAKIQDKPHQHGGSRVTSRHNITGDSAIIDDDKFGKIKVDMKSFKKKAIDKTDEFIKYINVITNPKGSREDANSSIDQAIKLFTNEDATVQVSSVVKNKKGRSETYKIREYLTSLKMHAHFDKIVIDYANVTYVPRFKKGTDGLYYSVVSFVQRFEGFNDGQMTYGDFTKKDVTVVLKSYIKTDVNGVDQLNWDVFLSDIGVRETTTIGNTSN